MRNLFLFFHFHRTGHCNVSVQKCFSASGCLWSFLPSSLSAHVFIFCGVDFPDCGGEVADVDTCMTEAQRASDSPVVMRPLG